MVKFKVDGTDFCSALKRAMCMLNPSGITDDYSVCIVASGERVNICVDREKMNLDIVIPAEVESAGEFMLRDTAIGKLTGFSDFVIVVADEEKVTVRNSKKSRSTSVSEFFKFYHKINAGESAIVLEANAGDLIETFANLNKAISDSNARPIYTGFNFNTSKGRIEALDCYRVHMRKFDMCNVKPFVVPGDVNKHLKAVADKKDTIRVYRHDKYVSFSGRDFVMQYKLLDGEFLDVDKIVVEEHTRRMFVDCNIMSEIAKEYKKLKYNDSICNIRICGESDTAYAGTIHYDNVIVDNLSARCENMDEFNITMNLVYVADAVSMFNGEVEMQFSKEFSAISITDHAGKYEAIVLPVRNKNNDYYRIRYEIDQMRGEPIEERE